MMLNDDWRDYGQPDEPDETSAAPNATQRIADSAANGDFTEEEFDALRRTKPVFGLRTWGYVYYARGFGLCLRARSMHTASAYAYGVTV